MNINVPSLAREIVAKRLAITAGATSILAFLVASNIIPVDWSERAITYLVVALNILGVIVGAVWSRAGVTPVNSPSVVPEADTPLATAAGSALPALAAAEAIYPAPPQNG